MPYGLNDEIEDLRKLLKASMKRVSELEAELAESRAYADKLAEGLPCLPADIENLREANAHFAQENFELKQKLGIAQ